jgi:23S rRNA pseudouridine1911/1915/1917 synthase
MILRSFVPPNIRSCNIIDYLSGRFTYLPAGQWRERCGEKRIAINGAACDSSDTVSGGDEIAYEVAEFEEPEADLGYSIVYEDDRFLGVNKPGNLLVHRRGKAFRHNLMYQVRYEHNPPYPSAHAVNRLDRETSGVVLLARDTDALRAMQKMFSGRAVEKTYVAVVHGVISPARGIVSFAIGRDPSVRMPVRFCKDGENPKDAFTEYTVIRPLGREFCLVELLPLTGRTHQLRVHMAGIGHPVLGDAIYGPGHNALWSDDKRADTGSGPGNIRRHALHCASLRFLHPFSGGHCFIRAPLPSDMETAIELIEQVQGG